MEKRVVVPLSLAYIEEVGLPAVSKRVIRTAANMAGGDEIVITGTEFCYEPEIFEKKNLLISLGIDEEKILTVKKAIRNTNEEVRGVRDLLDEAGIEPKSITFITHRNHMPRAKFFFQTRFPSAEIVPVSVPGSFEKNHPQVLLRYPVIFWAASFAQLILLKIFGVDSWASRLQQPRA